MDTRLFSNFSKYSVLVIGDVIIDKYIQGKSTRLTPEGPVPVVDIISQNSVLGGAANVAVNLKSLGANVTLCSVVGKDETGEFARQQLRIQGIDTRLEYLDSIATNLKTRVISNGQLIVRYDLETRYRLLQSEENNFLRTVEQEFSKHDFILISDYDKGLLSDNVIAKIKELSCSVEIPIVIDSKRLTLFKGLMPNLVKPNYKEAIELLDLNTERENRVEQLSTYGPALHTLTGAKIVVVTLDDEGSMVFENGRLAYRGFAIDVQNSQVSGAGDTYISTFSLLLMVGVNLQKATEISSASAAISIAKRYTATCTLSELQAFLSRDQKFIVEKQQIRNIVKLYRSQGKKIVFTNGCFDLIHSGHIHFLNEARSLGEILIIGLNTDDSIKRLKGALRPINGLEERITVLSGLAAVNHIVPFGEVENDMATTLIEIIKPDFYVKGANHNIDELKESKLVRHFGGEALAMPLYPDQSTKSTIERVNQIKI